MHCHLLRQQGYVTYGIQDQDHRKRDPVAEAPVRVSVVPFAFVDDRYV